MSRPHASPASAYVGRYQYFLTICTFNRQPFFVERAAVEDTLLQFRKTAAIEVFEFFAYCFMPDHLHLLTQGREERSDFKRLCKLAKQRSGGVHARVHGSRLWQEGYYDRVLRESDDPVAVARYLLNNPVRAGLVTSPIDYPFLGSDRWTVKELIEAQQLWRV